MSIKHVLSLCGLLGALVPLHAQSYELKGRVKDQTGAEVAFATVYLYRAPDTALVRSEYADETGAFVFPDIPEQLYFLKASYVGSFSDYRAIDVSADTDAGTLNIRLENQLDEVVVTGEQPTIKREAGKVVFRVENTILSTGSTADILARSPGVIEQGGTFYLRGQPAAVYLNGRPLPLNSSEVQDLLEGLSGANIQSVEVMANPGAQYSAEAGAILNVITSKNVTPGYKGSFQLSQEQAVVPKYRFGLSQYFKSRNWNLFLGYTFSPRNLYTTYDAQIIFDPTVGDSQRWVLSGDQNQRRRTNNLNGLVQYTLGEKSSLEYAFNLQLDPNRTSQSEYVNDIFGQDGSGLISGFTTLGNTDGSRTNFSNDLAYKYEGEKNSLTWTTNMTRFVADNLQRLNTTYFDENRQPESDAAFDTQTDQDIDIYTSQLDFGQSMGESSLDAGLRFSYIGSDNRINYSGFTADSPVADSADSDTFSYLERVYAAYVNYVEGGWDQWALTAGLRLEHTNSEGFSDLLGETARFNFTELFPTVQLLFQPGDAFSIAFDYNRGIDRPDYQDLNPFRYFFTEQNFLEGNPQLGPVFNHNLNLNFTFADSYFVDIYYRDNGEIISELVFQDNDQFVLSEQKRNLLGSVSYGLDFTVSKPITPGWYLYTYASLFHEEETFIAEESGGQEFTNDYDGFYISLTNYLTLSKDRSWRGELEFFYLSGLISGSYVDDSSNNLSIGLSKSLWDGRAELSIRAEDLLDGANFRTRSVYLNQNNDFLYFSERQFVRLSFTYNFGNFRLNEGKKNIESDELDRLKPEE